MSQETYNQEQLRAVADAYVKTVEELVRALDWLGQGNNLRMREFGLLHPPVDPVDALAHLYERVRTERHG